MAGWTQTYTHTHRSLLPVHTNGTQVFVSVHTHTHRTKVFAVSTHTDTGLCCHYTQRSLLTVCTHRTQVFAVHTHTHTHTHTHKQTHTHTHTNTHRGHKSLLSAQNPNSPMSDSVSKKRTWASGSLVLVRTPCTRSGNPVGLMNSALGPCAHACWAGLCCSFCCARLRKVARFRRFRA